MRTELFGGPHDGAIVIIDGTPPVWQEAVPLTTAEVHERNIAPPGVITPTRIAEYRRSTDGRYRYIGQHWL